MANGMHVDLSSAPPKCQPCILGKRTRTSVPKTRKGQHAEEVLDCIYVDLSGPQSVQSASGNSYIMNLVDDMTSFCWTIPIPLKSLAIKHLKPWVLQVEREMGKKVSAFNINNGELKSTEFVEFCASKGIKPRWTSPHTLAQKGRVEHAHYMLFIQLTQWGLHLAYHLIAGMNSLSQLITCKCACPPNLSTISRLSKHTTITNQTFPICVRLDVALLYLFSINTTPKSFNGRRNVFSLAMEVIPRPTDATTAWCTK